MVRLSKHIPCKPADLVGGDAHVAPDYRPNGPVDSSADAVAGLRMAIDLVRAATVPIIGTALNADEAALMAALTPKANIVTILEKRIEELASPDKAAVV
jgi:hypothetical protein